MLSRLKFIPRDQLDKAGDKDDESRRQEKKRKEKEKRKNRSSQYNSSDEDGLERTKKHSRKKKWYSSDEGSASPSGSESGSASDRDEKGHRYKKREKKIRKSSSKDKPRDKSKKKLMDDGEGSTSPDKSSIMRKELGLDWMLRPKDNTEREIVTMTDQLEEPEAEEVKKANPRELNPYLKNNGTGYPEEVDESRPRKDQLLSSAVVGDGGASWRLKGLKRAQEQAAREGRTLSEVVEERWGSIGELSVSLASYKAAPSRAHLHAIKNRQKGINEEQKTVAYDQNEKNTQRLGRQGVSHHHPEAKVPKVHDSLSWSKRKSQNMSSKDSILISTAMSSINKFANDGSFMREVTCEKNDFPVGFSSNNFESKVESELVSSDSQPRESHGINIEGLSANQLAAKALQFRLKGKHDEADRLSKVAENIKAKQVSGDESCRPQKECYTRRHMIHELSIQRKKSEDDGDAHLARQIAQNRKYSASRSNQADDEYDFDDGLRRKDRKKRGSETRSNAKPNFSERFLTQQERCRFCFENPNRPRHLVIAIANFTYLSLPHWQPVVPSHCCILTLQHESATRAVDDNVWDEIRNFKKCLIMMFSKQEMDVVFLETVMGLAKQRRHCVVEVIPLPRATAKAAPLYFKKAIDEAEDEWSQHNAKKLIDTSEKGLRGSIPKDFPYFHVEFGLDKGFVHVIDDETQFKSNFGLNIIRGMLQLPEEDMYGRRKHESFETQKQAVASFAKDWQPFDWTKQLE